MKIDYRNTYCTFGELAKMTGKIYELEDFQQLFDHLGRRVPAMAYSGRNNHPAPTELLAALDPDTFTVGGQGTAKPDLFINQVKAEQKGYGPEDKKVTVAASKLRANNGQGTVKLEEFLKTNPSEEERLNYMIEQSYNKDPVYVLTSTNKSASKKNKDWDGVWENTELIITETKTFIPILEGTKKKPFSQVNLNKLKERCRHLYDVNNYNPNLKLVV